MDDKYRWTGDGGNDNFSRNPNQNLPERHDQMQGPQQQFRTSDLPMVPGAPGGSGPNPWQSEAYGPQMQNYWRPRSYYAGNSDRGGDIYVTAYPYSQVNIVEGTVYNQPGGNQYDYRYPNGQNYNYQQYLPWQNNQSRSYYPQNPACYYPQQQYYSNVGGNQNYNYYGGPSGFQVGYSGYGGTPPFVPQQTYDSNNPMSYIMPVLNTVGAYLVADKYAQVAGQYARNNNWNVGTGGCWGGNYPYYNNLNTNYYSGYNNINYGQYRTWRGPYGA